MTGHVAVTRHTSQVLAGADGDRRAASRFSGRRILVLVVLACASVTLLAARSAQAATSAWARRSPVWKHALRSEPMSIGSEPKGEAMYGSSAEAEG